MKLKAVMVMALLALAQVAAEERISLFVTADAGVKGGTEAVSYIQNRLGKLDLAVAETEAQADLVLTLTEHERKTELLVTGERPLVPVMRATLPFGDQETTLRGKARTWRGAAGALATEVAAFAGSQSEGNRRQAQIAWNHKHPSRSFHLTLK